jgi:hypothetical protein
MMQLRSGRKTRDLAQVAAGMPQIASMASGGKSFTVAASASKSVVLAWTYCRS